GARRRSGSRNRRLRQAVAMHYYRVRTVTDERGRKRPDVPAGTPWVGNTDGEWYLIKTPVELSTNRNCQRCQPIPDAVEATAQDLGLEPRDPLDVWAIMGER